MNLSSFVIPVLLAAVAVFGMGKRVDVYAALTRGAEDGVPSSFAKARKRCSRAEKS